MPLPTRHGVRAVIAAVIAMAIVVLPMDSRATDDTVVHGGDLSLSARLIFGDRTPVRGNWTSVVVTVENHGTQSFSGTIRVYHISAPLHASRSTSANTMHAVTPFYVAPGGHSLVQVPILVSNWLLTDKFKVDAFDARGETIAQTETSSNKDHDIGSLVVVAPPSRSRTALPDRIGGRLAEPTTLLDLMQVRGEFDPKKGEILSKKFDLLGNLQEASTLLIDSESLARFPAKLLAIFTSWTHPFQTPLHQRRKQRPR